MKKIGFIGSLLMAFIISFTDFSANVLQIFTSVDSLKSYYRVQEENIVTQPASFSEANPVSPPIVTGVPKSPETKVAKPSNKDNKLAPENVVKNESKPVPKTALTSQTVLEGDQRKISLCGYEEFQLEYLEEGRAELSNQDWDFPYRKSYQPWRASLYLGDFVNIFDKCHIRLETETTLFNKNIIIEEKFFATNG